MVGGLYEQAKLLVDGFTAKITRVCQELRALVYPSAIDLSTASLRHLAHELSAHRHGLGTRWRRLTPGGQALLVLAHLRCGDTCAQLAAGFGIGIATVHRYVREAIQTLAALAPTPWPPSRPEPPRHPRPSDGSTPP